MIGLETRGTRPRPGSRGPAAANIIRWSDRESRRLRPYLVHELLWGVPCGPVPAMVPASAFKESWWLRAQMRASFSVVPASGAFVKITGAL